MSLKIGDRVSIKSYDWIEKHKLIYIDPITEKIHEAVLFEKSCMFETQFKYAGKTATIIDIIYKYISYDKTKYLIEYFLDIDCGDYIWTKEMFE